MKRVVLSVMVLAAVALSSCEKLSNPIAGGNSFKAEASAQDAMVFVSSSDYQTSEASELVQDGEHGAYSSGAIEYIENGEVTNRIEFREGNKAIYSNDNSEMKYELKKQKKGDDYEKVVVNPIVKSEDCDCVVAGTVEFFKDNDWIATVDYGNGECDDIATKTWADGSEDFEIDCGKDKKDEGKDGEWDKENWGKDDKDELEKIVVSEIVKSDDCDCIVSGVVEYHDDKDFVVTVDYGNGSCDNLATKSYTKDGVDYNEEFELDCDK